MLRCASGSSSTFFPRGSAPVASRRSASGSRASTAPARAPSPNTSARRWTRIASFTASLFWTCCATVSPRRKCPRRCGRPQSAILRPSSCSTLGPSSSRRAPLFPCHRSCTGKCSSGPGSPRKRSSPDWSSRSIIAASTTSSRISTASDTPRNGRESITIHFSASLARPRSSLACCPISPRLRASARCGLRMPEASAT